MALYIVRRLLLLVPLFVGVSFLTFMLLRIGGTNPATLIAGPLASAEQIAAVEEELGADDPLLEQYVRYVRDALSGELGTSWVTNTEVSAELRQRLPTTLELWLLGMVGAVAFGVGLGTVSAFTKDKVPDHLTRVSTLLGLSVPIFWLGLILIFVFFVTLGWAPAPFGRIDTFVFPPETRVGTYLVDSLLAGNWEAFWSAAGRLVLPVATIALTTGATIAKQTRAAVLEVLGSDIVRFARASGLPRRQIWWLALRNALPGIITYVGIASTLALGGTALVEQVFSWGGFGQFALESIVRADFAVVQAFVFVVGLTTVAVYLAADLLVAAIDPRVSYR